MSDDLSRLSPPDVPLLTVHDFTRPPIVDKGDDDVSVLLHAVGSAINTWQGVEVVMAEMFAVLLQTRSLAAHRAIGSLASFVAQKEMVHASAAIALSQYDDTRERLNTLLNVAVEASSRRNDIAHGMIIDYWSNGKERGHVLAPSFYNPKRTKPQLRPAYMYNSAVIMGFMAKFALLQRQMFDFRTEVSRLLPSWSQTPDGPAFEPRKGLGPRMPKTD